MGKILEKKIVLEIDPGLVDYGFRKGFGTRYEALDGSVAIGVHTHDQLKKVFDEILQDILEYNAK